LPRCPQLIRRDECSAAYAKQIRKEFPPTPLFRNFRAVTALRAPAGTARKKSLGGGLGESLSSDLSAAQVGTPPRDSAEAATSLSRRRKRLRPSREGGWQARRFPPGRGRGLSGAGTRRERPEPKFLIMPLTWHRGGFALKGMRVADRISTDNIGDIRFWRTRVWPYYARNRSVWCTFW